MWGVGDTGRNEAALGPASGVDVSYVRGGNGKEVRGEEGLGEGGGGVSAGMVRASWRRGRPERGRRR